MGIGLAEPWKIFLPSPFLITGKAETQSWCDDRGRLQRAFCRIQTKTHHRSRGIF